MLFNSSTFLFGFLPLTVLGAVLAQRFGDKPLKVWLALASLLFYGWWSASYLLILVASIAANFLLAKKLHALPSRSRPRKLAVTAGILLNLCVLGWFKYAGFLSFNVNALTGAQFDLGDIVLPLGISFFTFQKIAFLIDIYRDEIDEFDFTDFFLFVSFFPQLIAGPIVLFREIGPQLRRPGQVRVRLERVAVGLTVFAFGLAKKTYLADDMERFATPMFDAVAAGRVISSAEAWTGALAYSFQIYFDFSGYSDMAVGLACMFGIALPFNFNSPYKALSIIDFWRRWHVTLSRFLKAYLYIPLGGNRRGTLRRHANLLTVMLLGGLWHGAAWTFVLWGALHGVFLLVNHLWRDLTRGIPAPRSRAVRAFVKAGCWLSTFVAVVVAWVFFRAGSAADAVHIVTLMFDPPALQHMLAHGYLENRVIPRSNVAPQTLAAMLLIVLVLPNTQQIMGKYFPVVPGASDRAAPTRFSWRPSTVWAAVVALFLTFGILSLSEPKVFIYYQF